MPAESANASILERGYEAFNRGDIDAVLDLLDPAVEISVLSDSPMQVSGGREGFRRMAADNEEMFSVYRVVPEEMVEVTDEHVVVAVRAEARGRTSGIEVEGRLAHLWTVRDGRALRFEAFASKEEALAAARERTQDA